MEDEDAIVLACDGFKAGGLAVPKFELHWQEVVTLVWPLGKSHPSERLAFQILTGARNHPSVRISAPIERAVSPTIRRTLLGSVRLYHRLERLVPKRFIFKFYNAFDRTYAIKYGGRYSPLSDADEASLRACLHLEPQCALDAIQGNGRALLGLKAVWDRADVAIFDTMGCTQSILYRAVAKRLPDGKAALEIAYPKTNQPDYYPGSRRFTVERL